MSNSSIWPIDRTLSDATTLSQSRSGSDGNEGVLCIPQSSSITRASPSDCLLSYPGYSLEGVLSLQRGKTPLTCILDMTVSNLMCLVTWPSNIWCRLLLIRYAMLWTDQILVLQDKRQRTSWRIEYGSVEQYTFEICKSFLKTSISLIRTYTKDFLTYAKDLYHLHMRTFLHKTLFKLFLYFIVILVFIQSNLLRK